jgi:hypothetical protein
MRGSAPERAERALLKHIGCTCDATCALLVALDGGLNCRCSQPRFEQGQVAHSTAAGSRQQETLRRMPQASHIGRVEYRQRTQAAVAQRGTTSKLTRVTCFRV